MIATGLRIAKNRSLLRYIQKRTFCVEFLRSLINRMSKTKLLDAAPISSWWYVNVNLTLAGLVLSE